jgi:CheY-like chemotaxis protein
MQHNRTIWIVDDTDEDRYIAERVLKKHFLDLHVTTFACPVDAFHAIKELYLQGKPFPDLILLDLSMPVMNGFEWMEALREIQSERPLELNIVILTSSADRSDQIQAGKYSWVKAFLSKPLSKEHLQMIQYLLQEA